MLREILGVAAEPHARRRWFHDEHYDLFVWQAKDGEVVSFQLCYGAASSGQALVWNRETGFFHDGRARPGTLARFDGVVADLPPDIRPTLTERVLEYTRHSPAVATRRKRFRREDWQKLEPETRSR